MTTLAARRADAGPRTARGRFVPTRAGIINLWDYRDEEFVFADGWLVLRGPNGSGKTKALEVLFPFVLDGRIEPRRLNPFASEERTMKSNLLYRGQESTLAYAWLEFANTDEYVTVGVGLRAQRHTDRVTRWYFVADGRVGVDFALLDAEDRPIVRKHLVAQLGGDAVRDGADEHRAAVDARLFGLGPERYEQLINLVLTLRRPQLAKNLDPARLSDTLTEGLRPIDSELLIEAARSFDDMEAVQRTLDGLAAADEATRTFLGIYSTYLRTHARAATDGVSRRRADSAAHREALGAARSALSAATGTLTGARSDVVAAEAEPPRLRAHLDRLKTSAAYQSVGQLADLERLVRELGDSAERAAAAYRTRQSETARRISDAATAERHRRDREAEASRLAATLAEEAEAAGIAWSGPDAEPDDFATRVTARVAGRQADVTAVRQAADRLAQARRDRDRAAEAAAQARLAVEAAEAAEAAAEVQVARVRAEARDRLDAWARRHATPLAALDPTVTADLARTLAAAGEPEAPDLRAAFATAVAPVEQRFREELAQLRTRRAAIDADLARVETERAAIAAEQDDAPVPFGARPAPRHGRPGAPLWRLVRFADQVADTEAAAIEAALEAANLLDAWVSPSTVDSIDGDGYLEPVPASQRPSGRTLADLLVAEEQDHVPAARIASILGSVAVRDVAGVDVGPPVVSAGGRFAQGIQLGGYAKPAAEFIGTTARARRRALRLADCERRLAELRADMAGVDRECALVAAALDALGAAARDLPGVGAILRAVRDHDRAATTLRAKREAADAASAVHDVTVAEAAAAETALRRTCAERSLPADQVEPIAEAVRRFERAGDRLSGVRREVGEALAAEVAATDRLDQAAEQEEAARLAAEAAERRQVAEAEQLATLQTAIGAAAEAVLRDVADTEVAIEVAESALGAARERLLDAERETAAARQDVSAGEAALQTAVAEERREAQALAPFAHADLLELLRCPDHLRWPALSADWAGDELPAPVAALHEAILAVTKDLTPTETSIKQSATRLHRALDDLQGQLSAAGQDHRPEWDTDDGILVVRVADEQGYAPVKVFADRIARDRRDQEVLLTEAERRILEDTLLASLARQIHQRTVDARDLVEAMDAEMRTRRMSSGVSVGVGWHLADDLDEAQRDVCKLLERDPARLGPDQLNRIREHFAHRIKVARATHGDRPYRDLLAHVLDYRRWRMFAFRLHRPGGVTDALTKARHSQLSGGEQSVSLHLPLFAAAHALFTSARPTSPRLLALDEAFAGVDDTGRSELMALAVQFDLDLLMTGYDLWATHAAVPGCAHYDLTHSAIDHIVSCLLIVWDGAESLADFDGSLSAALGSPGTRGRTGTAVPAGGPILHHPAAELLLDDPDDTG